MYTLSVAGVVPEPSRKMAKAGEGGTSGSPVQPLLGRWRATAVGRSSAHPAQPLRSPRRLRAAQALRRVPLSTPRPRACAVGRRLSDSLLPPSSSAAASSATGDDVALHLGSLLSQSPGEHGSASKVGQGIDASAAADRSRATPGGQCDVDASTAAECCCCSCTATYRRVAAKLAHRKRWTAGHRQEDQQHRLAAPQG